MDTTNAESEYIKEYSFSNDTGDAVVTIYHIFPGVEVAYITVHMDTFDFKMTEKEMRDKYVGFHWCQEGRIEQETDGEFFYLMPGDCSVVIRDKHAKQFSFPTKHYHGISIGIDMAIASEHFSELLKLVDLKPMEVAKRICGDRHARILRSASATVHIMNELFTVRKEERLNFLRIKVHELLYVLNTMELSDSDDQEITVPRSQVDFVKQAAGYITEHISEKLTVADLTRRFGVSDTYLQNSFRLVYGMPVISFIRAQKMQCAAQVLIHTDRSVDSIAEEFGYVNESKFSAVFKKIMGDAPSIYRKEHSKIKIL